jgi:hypothetical protein
MKSLLKCITLRRALIGAALLVLPAVTFAATHHGDGLLPALFVIIVAGHRPGGPAAAPNPGVSNSYGTY